MEPIFYVLALMGCPDDGGACTEARVAPARYSSIQACQAAMPAALLRNTDIDFPSITAACRSNTVRMVDQQAVRRAARLNPFRSSAIRIDWRSSSRRGLFACESFSVR